MKFTKIVLSPNNFLSWVKQKKYSHKYRHEKLSIGMNCDLVSSKIGHYNFIGDSVLLENSSLSDYSYINSRSFISNASIGKFTSIAHDVHVGLGAHPIDMVSTHGAFYSKNKGFKTFADREYFNEFTPINIGNDVWLGARSIVLNGVTIGDGAVIAAGAVVTKDVEPYAVVGGVPARLIKYRFEKEIIEKLLTIKWWDLDPKWLSNNYLLFHDINKFLKHFENNSFTE